MGRILTWRRVASSQTMSSKKKPPRLGWRGGGCRDRRRAPRTDARAEELEAVRSGVTGRRTPPTGDEGYAAKGRLARRGRVGRVGDMVAAENVGGPRGETGTCRRRRSPRRCGATEPARGRRADEAEVRVDPEEDELEGRAGTSRRVVGGQWPRRRRRLLLAPSRRRTPSRSTKRNRDVLFFGKLNRDGLEERNRCS